MFIRHPNLWAGQPAAQALSHFLPEGQVQQGRCQEVQGTYAGTRYWEVGLGIEKWKVPFIMHYHIYLYLISLLLILRWRSHFSKTRLTLFISLLRIYVKSQEFNIGSGYWLYVTMSLCVYISVYYILYFVVSWMCIIYIYIHEC